MVDINNSEYWRARNQERSQIKEQLNREDGYSKEIRQLYRDTRDEVNREIQSSIYQFADDEGLSIKEARKKIDSFDVEQFQNRVAKYINDDNLSPKGKQVLNNFNVSMRTSRLELLNKRIGIETVRLADAEEAITREILEKEAILELERQAGIHEQSLPDGEQLQSMVKTIVDAEFHNQTFDDRIWDNQRELQKRLESTIKGTILQGKSPLDGVKQLRELVNEKEFSNASYAARRLAITETARVQTTTQEESYKENDFEQYMFIAEPTACDDCAELDGEIFKVEDMEPGTNAPTMHPFCKCSTVAHYDSTELDAELDRINESG